MAKAVAVAKGMVVAAAHQQGVCRVLTTFLVPFLLCPLRFVTLLSIGQGSGASLLLSAQRLSRPAAAATVCSSFRAKRQETCFFHRRRREFGDVHCRQHLCFDVCFEVFLKSSPIKKPSESMAPLSRDSGATTKLSGRICFRQRRVRCQMAQTPSQDQRSSGQKERYPRYGHRVAPLGEREPWC